MNWVTEAREQFNKKLAKIPKFLFVVSKDFAVDLLCKELEKIPVPFVGTSLSKAVKEAAKSGGKSGPSIDDVLKLLQEMKTSDNSFLQGLSDLGQDMDRLETLCLP